MEVEGQPWAGQKIYTTRNRGIKVPKLKMFSLLLATILFHYAASVPVDPSNGKPSPPSPTAATVVPTMRSMFDVVWSCLLTLFLCTWTTEHPNIPPPNEGVLHEVLRRIKLMLWTLLVPELILIWAVRQWLAAGYIAGMFKGAFAIFVVCFMLLRNYRS